MLLMLGEQLTKENVFLVSCSKCGEILGYHTEREKEECEEYTSVSSIFVHYNLGLNSISLPNV